MNSDEELIIKIFNNMNFEDEAENNYEPVDLGAILKSYLCTSVSLVTAVDEAIEAQIKWQKFSGLKRSDILNKVWKSLIDTSEAIPGLKYNFTLLADYFDLYSDLAAHIVKLSAEPIGIVLIILPPHPCFFILGATVSAALAAGCSVIVRAEQTVIPLFLERILQQAGLPNGAYTVVTEPLTDFNKVAHHIQKTIFCGSLSAAQDFYFEKAFESFKFFCPNNTAAFVLESCDLNAAVSNIFQKTCKEASFWAVSTVVVQESIIEEFLNTLKFQKEQFLNMNTKFKYNNVENFEKILEAVKVGAVFVQMLSKENEWGPTAPLNYQNQPENLYVLKILVCRTSKEGVNLLNDCYSAFGTSIWSEYSSQALEIASQLKSPNIWINCHGVVDAKVPLSLTRLNGNFVLGGKQGILEYLTTGVKQRCELKVKDKIATQKLEALQIVHSAKKAFDSWHVKKNKKKYLKAFANYLERNEKFSVEAEFLNYLSSFENYPYYSEKNFTEEFFIVYEEVPVGVICIFISLDTDIKAMIPFIALPIALGNAVILVFEQECSFVANLIEFFNENIQKNLLTTVCGTDSALYLASDPHVQAFWICDESVLTLQELRKESSKDLKHIWLIPKLTPEHMDLFLIQCVRRKIIWLPKVDKFP